MTFIWNTKCDIIYKIIKLIILIYMNDLVSKYLSKCIYFVFFIFFISPFSLTITKNDGSSQVILSHTS